eukprot:m.85309 g.85309  ORF g.85309 m.85309 type:complete len:644 (+) comp21258_c0_seq1:159-2090(+)
MYNLGTRGYVKVLNSTWEHTNEDQFTFFGKFMTGFQIINSTHVIIGQGAKDGVFPFGVIQENHTLDVFDQNFEPLVQGMVVSSVKLFYGPCGGKRHTFFHANSSSAEASSCPLYATTFASPLPPVIRSSLQTIIVNRDFDAGNYVVANSTFAHNRGSGLNVGAHSGLVTNNHFLNNQISGAKFPLAWDDLSNGNGARNTTFANNYVANTNVFTNFPTQTAAAVSFFTSKGSYSGNPIANSRLQNIWVHNNTISNTSFAAINLQGVNYALIENNTLELPNQCIDYNHRLGPNVPPSGAPLTVTHSSNVVIIANTGHNGLQPHQTDSNLYQPDLYQPCLPEQYWPEIWTTPTDLTVPRMINNTKPQPGLRVKETLPAYNHTQVYHATYLPVNWNATAPRGFPLLVDLAGNGPFHDQFKDVCTGKVQDQSFGYGLSAGRDFVWVCAPYLTANASQNEESWWGAPTYNVTPTVEHTKQLVKFMIETYNVDSNRVFLTGFSRGALAVNYIGLHDDEIASLWRGLVPYAHYDGRPLDTHWPYDDEDLPDAYNRLARIMPKKIPSFITEKECGVNRTRWQLVGYGFVSAQQPSITTPPPTGLSWPQFSFHSSGFVNHNDQYVLRPSPARATMRRWLSWLVGFEVGKEIIN